GRISSNNRETQIRLQGQYSSLDDIGNIIVMYLADGTTLRVKNIADVHDGNKEIETISRINGIPSVGITIQRSADANTVKISENTRAILDGLQLKHRASGLNFMIAADNAEFTMEASNSVLIDLTMAV